MARTRRQTSRRMRGTLSKQHLLRTTARPPKRNWFLMLPSSYDPIAAITTRSGPPETTIFCAAIFGLMLLRSGYRFTVQGKKIGNEKKL
mmetsp:Transcript_13309/g.29355  ORF Transcript_13309/g.29355 Transcript_13309/m.29355 type:complete len:89 (-) Transcript_13309:340-606(-)